MFESQLTVINGIYDVKRLIYEQLNLIKANKQQFKLLSDRITLIVTKIKELENTTKKPNFQKNMQELYSCLEQCLSFMKQFVVNSWKWFFLRTINYSSNFQRLNQSLQIVIQPLDLGINIQQIFNYQENQENLSIDLQDNQALIEKNHVLLKNFLEQQLNINNVLMESAVDAQKGSVGRTKFLYYQELTKDFQDQLFQVSKEWDHINDQECYNLLKTLNLIIISYELLKTEFKQQLSETTLMCRFAFVDENNKYPDLQECWNNYSELHLAWVTSSLQPLQEQRCFSFYRELSMDLQDNVLPAFANKSKDLLQKEWDDNNSEQCYKFLKSLSTSQSSSQSLPSLQSSLLFASSQSSQPLELIQSSYDYDCLNEKFKQQLSRATQLQRQALSTENSQLDFSMKKYWNECPELHVVWMKYCSSIQEQPTLMFSSCSQTTQVDNEGSQNTLPEEPQAKRLKLLPKTPNVEKILEEQEVSLLLLKITSTNDETIKFFIGLPNDRANLLLTRNTPITELDFEEADIINLFGEGQEIVKQELESIKSYCRKYFIPNMKVHHSLSLKSLS